MLNVLFQICLKKLNTQRAHKRPLITTANYVKILVSQLKFTNDI